MPTSGSLLDYHFLQALVELLAFQKELEIVD